MKMLKGLEIMGLKQIQNAESVKKGTRLSSFGNLLSGFIFNKNTNPQKTKLNISGTHFVVKNQPSLKTASSKDAPVFIRPGTKQVPTMESLGGLLKKSSSEDSKNDLDPKSQVLILRALSAAFAKPADKSPALSPIKNSESLNVQAQLKQIGNKPVLVLTVKNAAKMEAVQKFVSKIETAAAKNQIKMPVIQVKAFPQDQKPSQQAKMTGAANGEIVSGKIPAGTQSIVKNQAAGKEVKNSNPQQNKTNIPENHQKGQTIRSTTAVKSEQAASKHGVQEKSVSIKQNGKEPNSIQTKQPVVKTNSSQVPEATSSKSDVRVGAKNIKQEQPLETPLKPARTKESQGLQVNKNAAPGLKNEQAQTVSKSSTPAAKTIPAQGTRPPINKQKIASGPVKGDHNAIKENPNNPKLIKPAGALTSDKPNSMNTDQELKPVAFKTQTEAPKERPQKSEMQVRKTIQNGRIDISRETADNVKPSTLKTNPIKTQETKNPEEMRPKQNSEIRLTDSGQKIKASPKPKTSTTSSPIHTKGELLQQQIQQNTESGKNARGNPDKIQTTAKIQPKEDIAFTPAVGKNTVKPKSKKEEIKKEVSDPGKHVNSTKEAAGKGKKLHDFSEKTISKSGNGQSGKSETETVLEFGKQGNDKNVQKEVSEAGMTNGTHASREIQVPVKFAPLVSRINELIQKFKASTKQTSVKTSFKVSAGSAGEVEIQLDEKTKEKTIKIRVESDKVRNELQKTLPQIQHNLILKGIEFSSIAIDTAPFGSKMNQTQDQQRGSQKSKPKQSKEVQNEQEQPAVTQKKYGYNTIEVIA